MVIRALILLALLLLPSAYADAQDAQVDQPARGQGSDVPPSHAASAKDESRRKRARKVEVGGRVFFRDTVERLDVPDTADWSNDLSVDSARVGVAYKDRARDLEIEVEAEIAGGVKLKDGYVRWQPSRHVRIQAGQFKEPIGAISLASRWKLPAIERGLLSDFELANAATGEPDVLPVGGRNVGVAVALRGRDLPLRPQLQAAVFRSRVHDQLATALGENRVPISAGKEFPEDLYSRLEIQPVDGVHLGVSVGWIAMLETAGTRDTFTHGLVAGVDAVVDVAPVALGSLRLVPLRLWLEGFVGDSPVHMGIDMLAQGRFTAARAIGSVRLVLPHGPVAYVEPYGAVQYLDASDAVTDDTAHESGAGLVVGLSESWRVQMGYDRRHVDNRLSGGNSRFTVQAGAVF